MHIGTVVKILHNKQKHYAVVANYQGKSAVVRTVTYGDVDGVVSVKELTVPLKEIRPVSDSQTLAAFVMLRQMVGVRLEEPAPAKKVGHALGKVAVPVDVLAQADDTDDLD